MKDWKAPRRASRVSTAARSIPFPASSRRSELFCHAQRRLSLTPEDGRNPTAVLPGLVRGDEATRTQPYDASSSGASHALQN